LFIDRCGTSDKGTSTKMENNTVTALYIIYLFIYLFWVNNNICWSMPYGMVPLCKHDYKFQRFCNQKCQHGGVMN